MEYKYEYKNQDERELIINNHSDLFLREEQNIAEGNFLIFVDSQTHIQDQITEDLNGRISDVSDYLQNETDLISVIESSIIQTELNKLTN
ncbi:hypothetical protein [Clostridium sp.]|uniref:hypothetical protein n=1 Tax=Clostridium sp. TaxID=1506 RepID=UPI0026029B2B|nr:hypothetical protein [Clostridium sp.]